MKTYLRYRPDSGTGVVCSTRSNSVIARHEKSIMAVTPAFEDALVWDVMKGELRARFLQRREFDGEVSCLTLFNPQSGGSEFAVAGTLVIGRTRGRIDLHHFNAVSIISGTANVSKQTSGPRASLSGHSSAVVCASFNVDGSRLATGSMDTYVVVWDPVTETGLFRLRGHKDEVTSVRFCAWLGESEQLVSGSKDTTVKVWDMASQHCEKTLADHPSAVWCLQVFDVANRKRILTGSSDGLLRSYDTADLERVMPGSVGRQTSQRAETMQVCGDIIAVQSTGKVVEFYRIRSEERASKKQKRRLRRLREKGKDFADEDERSWTQDELELACVLRSAHRARSVSLVSGAGRTVLCLVTYTDNLAEVYSLTTEEVAGGDDDDDEQLNSKRTKTSSGGTKLKSTLSLISKLELQGHRTDIRCVALGDNDELAVTGGDGAVKLWNVASGACLRTMPCGFALCLAFSPSSLHSIVGTQEGQLVVHGLNDGSVVKEVERAHEGEPVFSLDIRPDGTEFVTCGGDRQCKFWKLKSTGDPTQPIALVNTRTLRLGDSGDAQCVRYARGAKSPDQLKVCVGMLDSTVKVFHEDSIEFHLSLYGHKLPVLTMDASDDGALLATGSADKTIKIWGLDFGDCHRSAFAHDGSVTAVRFVPRTHYLVSCGRDGRVRYWDCDSNMERILSFDHAHFGDAFSLAVAADASFFVSVGKDKRLRRFDRTRDIVFPTEERNKDLAREAEEEREGAEDENTAVATTANGMAEESAAVAKRTMQAVEAGDKLVECLLGMIEGGQGEDEEEDVFLTRVGMAVATTARSCAPQDLVDALVFFPSVHVRPMLVALAFALKSRIEIETSTKAALTLIKIHGAKLIAPKDREAVELLRLHMREALWDVRDLVGKNAAGLRWLSRQADDASAGGGFDADANVAGLF